MRNSDGQASETRVLLVDDDPHLLEAMGDFLRFEGFAVTAATSGEEALRELARQAPRVVVLDIGMPGMGGLGFLRHAQELLGALMPPVLVLTARATMESFFHDLDVDAFMLKPCSGIQLACTLRSILNRRQQGPVSSVRHVLLVEDSHTRARQLTESLMEIGYTVALSHDGMDLFHLAARHVPDLVLIKENLRNIQGQQLVDMVRDYPETATIPVLLYESEGGAEPVAVAGPVDEWGGVVHTGDTATLMAAVKQALREPAEADARSVRGKPAGT